MESENVAAVFIYINKVLKLKCLQIITYIIQARDLKRARNYWTRKTGEIHVYGKNCNGLNIYIYNIITNIG